MESKIADIIWGLGIKDLPENQHHIQSMVFI